MRKLKSVTDTVTHIQSTKQSNDSACYINGSGIYTNWVKHHCHLSFRPYEECCAVTKKNPSEKMKHKMEQRKEETPVVDAIYYTTYLKSEEITIIKSTLSSIHAYYISVFPILSSHQEIREVGLKFSYAMEQGKGNMNGRRWRLLLRKV